MQEKDLEGTFHRRELKDPAIAFSSEKGTRLFREALVEGCMETYFFLSEVYTTQLHPAYCGIGSLSMALNALLIDPKRRWQGVWRWFDDEMLDCCELLDSIKEKGITMDKLAGVATCNGAGATIQYGPDMTLEEFRVMVQLSCSRCCNIKTVLIASYARGVLNQTGTGHFSPIGGYQPSQDMVLIMDVARFKYPPHWVPLTLLYEAFQAIDPDSNKPRGVLVISSTADKESGLRKRMLKCCDCNDDNEYDNRTVSTEEFTNKSLSSSQNGFSCADYCKGDRNSNNDNIVDSSGCKSSDQLSKRQKLEVSE